MATINIALINHGPINISRDLVDDKLYTVQLISPLGAAVHFILVSGNRFPTAPPKRAHLLTNHNHFQMKVPAGESIWAWTSVPDAVLVISEAGRVKTI